MRFQLITVRRAGSVQIFDEIEEGEGSRRTRAFLEGLAENFARQSRRFFDNTHDDLAFSYRERQLSGFIHTCLAQVADTVFSEMPIDRKHKGGTGHGWLDFWAPFRDATMFVEVKHTLSLLHPSREVPKRVSEKWADARDQLASITLAQARAHSKGRGPIVKIALLVAPYFMRTDPSESSCDVARLVNHRHFEIYAALCKVSMVSWSAIYTVNKEMIVPSEWDSGTEWYPAVGLFVSARFYPNT